MDEHRLLARQAGLITRAQALRCGVGSSTITRRVQAREWFVVLPGVYRHCGVVMSADLMVHAVVLWQPSAVLSGAWAAWWHGLRPEPVGPVSITAPRGSAARSRSVVDVRRRRLDPADVTVVRGVSVVTRALAALENASLKDGQDVMDRALQRFVSPVEFSTTLNRMSRARGAADARRSVADTAGGGVSPPERELQRALRRAGFDQIRAGVDVDADGVHYVVDFAVAGVKLAIEVDGYGPHSSPEQFRRDRKRQNDLVKAGWTVLRYTPQQIRDDIGRVLAEIATVLSSLGGL